MSRNSGKVFELDFKNSIPKGVYNLKLQDSVNGFAASQATGVQRFAAKSPYDYILCQDGHMYALELKSVCTKSMSYGNNPSARIKFRQVENLLKAERSGATAGLVLNFRKYEETYFIKASVFFEHMENSTKKSISVTEAKEIGFLIPQQIKKVHYRYDLSKILEIKNGK